MTDFAVEGNLPIPWYSRDTRSGELCSHWRVHPADTPQALLGNKTPGSDVPEWTRVPERENSNLGLDFRTCYRG